MILYFSGSGNSKFVAQAIAALTDDVAQDMKPAMKAGQPIEAASEKPFTFVFPVYAWGVPDVVEAALRAAKLTGSKDACFVMTCGSSTGGSYKTCQAICAAQGWEFRGFADVAMPDNTVVMFKMADEAQAKTTITAALPLVKDLAAKIGAGEPLGVLNHGGAAMSLLHKPSMVMMGWYKSWTVSDDCIGCGICAAACPTNRITVVDGKAAFGSEPCCSCYACIHHCPKHAVDVAGKSAKNGQYVAPAFDVAWLQ